MLGLFKLLKSYAEFLKTVTRASIIEDLEESKEPLVDDTTYTEEELRLIEYVTPYFEWCKEIPVWFEPPLGLIANFLPDETKIRFHKDYEDGVYERMKYPLKFKIRGGEVTIKCYTKMYSAFTVCRTMY
jgi:hypothetical protein